MEASERPRFVLALDAMAATFQRPMTEAGLTGYWMGLSDLPLGSVERAIAEAMRTRRFMPVCAELRELAGFGIVALEDRANIAWPVFTNTLQKYSGLKSVSFDDPGVNFAVRALRAWEDDEFQVNSYNQKRFHDAYCAFHRTGSGDGSPLIGFYDRENGKNGYGVSEPMHIACGLPPLLPHHSQHLAIADDRMSLVANIGKLAQE